jgi:nucleoside-diphosphate-sugar epimerase
LKTNTRDQQLDEALSTPCPALVEMMRRIEGDIMILGIAGKIGVTLGMAALKAIRQAGVSKRVIGVSRFSDPESRGKLEQYGIETIQSDLLDNDAVRRLPDVPNIIFMAGRKFGTSSSMETTWAVNTLVPANIASRFQQSTIVAFSTGCVYSLVPIESGGSKEDDCPDPVGEYAQSTLARERIFEYYSHMNKTPVCLVRLNYAIDLRYGVLRDIGDSVYAGQPVDVTMGYVNVIWQGDAINQSLLCLEQCASPPSVLNITGTETLSVKEIALEFGRQFSLDINLVGSESPTALLSNSSRATGLFGKPAVTVEQMIAWTAEWIKSGGPSLNKPTHFETRDGKF